MEKKWVPKHSSPSPHQALGAGTKVCSPGRGLLVLICPSGGNAASSRVCQESPPWIFTKTSYRPAAALDPVQLHLRSVCRKFKSKNSQRKQNLMEIQTSTQHGMYPPPKKKKKKKQAKESQLVTESHLLGPWKFSMVSGHQLPVNPGLAQTKKEWPLSFL